jgi:hypothetical protein
VGRVPAPKRTGSCTTYMTCMYVQEHVCTYKIWTCSPVFKTACPRSVACRAPKMEKKAFSRPRSAGSWPVEVKTRTAGRWKLKLEVKTRTAGRWPHLLRRVPPISGQSPRVRPQMSRSQARPAGPRERGHVPCFSQIFVSYLQRALTVLYKRVISHIISAYLA